MTNYILEYEWIINLVSLSIMTIFIILPEPKSNILKSVYGFIITVTYTVLLLSVFVNGFEKGF
jgi:hypothetical protein